MLVLLVQFSAGYSCKNRCAESFDLQTSLCTVSCNNVRSTVLNFYMQYFFLSGGGFHQCKARKTGDMNSLLFKEGKYGVFPPPPRVHKYNICELSSWQIVFLCLNRLKKRVGTSSLYFCNAFVFCFGCFYLQGMMIFSGIIHSWRNGSSPFMLVCFICLVCMIPSYMECTNTFLFLYRAFCMCKESQNSGEWLEIQL